MSPRPLKIFIHAMDGSGHLNACVGLAQALTKRGHRIVFLLNSAFKGQFAKFGFEEIVLERAQPPPSKDAPTQESPNGNNQPPENPVKIFARMILKTGMLGPKTPLEKLKADQKDDDEDFAKNLYASSVDFNPQIKKALDEGKPDLIILDHFLVPPGIHESGIPWLYLFSGNPMALINSDKLPPFSSGYSLDSDPALWAEFRSYQSKFQDNFTKYQIKLYETFGYEPKPENLPNPVFPQCKYGYIYGYPKELDYQDVIDIGEEYITLDAFCRETPEPFKLPEEFANRPGDKLIYFSLGSMGSVDVELVKRVCGVLAQTPYKCIVSKGPLADEYELPDNCWGEGYLPQTNLLPLVDLVITHGGNNTVTETFSFGKPMIVMPLFGDQYDNAQRIHEKGYGVRIDPYTFEDKTLLDAIDRLLKDTALHERLHAAAKRIETSNSKEKACERIEQLVEQYRN